MGQRRITMSNLVSGQPSPWDMVGANGKIIVRQGDTLGDTAALEKMVKDGLFADAESIRQSEPPSVLRLLNAANRRLERLLPSLTNLGNAQSAILEVSKAVNDAGALNQDVALACILLNQIAGGYAVRHCLETAVVAQTVARAMQLPERQILTIGAAALTMNIGMLGYHEQLESKRHGLSYEEIEAIHKHPIQGVNLLRQAGIDDEDWITYVMLHHESDDGSGYPEGKCSDDIPQNVRLISLADRYCAQVSARNYRKSVLPNIAMRTIMQTCDKTKYPQLLETFVQQIGSYPPGTYVRLQNQEIGIVAERRANDTPLVYALIDANGGKRPNPIHRETSVPDYAIVEALSEDQAAVRVGMKQLWGVQASL